MVRPNIVLVAGATGNQGGAVARRLLRSGHRVRSLVRDAGSQAAAELRALGAETFVADFGDPSALRQAMSAVASAFLVATPFTAGGTDTELRHGRNLVDAAAAAGVSQVVYSSVASADQSTGVPHFESKFEIEQQLRASGVPWTILAPTEFFENFVAPWAIGALRDGRIESAVPAHVPRQLTAVEDVAAIARIVIERPSDAIGRRIEFASDELTGAELASRLARQAHRRIRYVELPIEASGGDDLAAMNRFLAAGGYDVDWPASQVAFPDVDWTDADTWLAGLDWPSIVGAGRAA